MYLAKQVKSIPANKLVRFITCTTWHNTSSTSLRLFAVGKFIARFYVTFSMLITVK